MSRSFNPRRAISHQQWLRLVSDAVGVAVRTEDEGVFLDWMHAAVERHYHGRVQDSGKLHGLAFQLGRAIWNATPLPGNDYEPRPIPEPAPTAACPCGSQLAYTACCGRAPRLPELRQDEVWTLAVGQLSEAQLRALSRRPDLPAGALAELARQRLDAGRPRKAFVLLEPIFRRPSLAQLDGEQARFALNVLCEAADALGYRRKKRQLLEETVDHGPTLARARAWQQLAGVYAEADERERAWEAFAAAQRADPRDPWLAVLETSLWMADDAAETAAQRARMWRRRLERDASDDTEVLSFLREAQDHPGAALTRSALNAELPEAAPLGAWLARVVERPLPAYALAGAQWSDPHEPESIRSLVVERLCALGVAPEHVDLDAITAELGDALSADSATGEGSVLMAPPEVQAIEAEWRRVYTVGKPFGTERQPFSGIDPWDRSLREEWLAFLEAHPEAFDSIAVLDDLATAVDMLDLDSDDWLTTVLLRPVLARAERILIQTGAAGDGTALAPGAPANRSALRLLERIAELAGNLDSS